MDIYTEIQDKLETKKFQKLNKSFNEGYISSATSYETDFGKIFIKLCKDNSAFEMFLGEKYSLEKIFETKTIKVPKTYCIVSDPKSSSSNGGGGGAALVLEYLDLKPINKWLELGSNLADLHNFNSILLRKKKRKESWIGKPPVSELPEDFIEFKMEKEIKLSISDDIVEKVDPVEQFGFDYSTCCGRIEQNNEWHSDWIEFYARNRLSKQIDLAIENYGDRELVEYWSELQLKLHKFFLDLNQKIQPSLLHGDLWSGNIGQINNTDGDNDNNSAIPVIFDPASFYGHSEYDLAISKLFGGFHQDFFRKYFQKIPKQKGYEKREELYTLFHLLNHWNHFGGQYKIKAKNLMKKLNEYNF